MLSIRLMAFICYVPVWWHLYVINQFDGIYMLAISLMVFIYYLSVWWHLYDYLSVWRHLYVMYQFDDIYTRWRPTAGSHVHVLHYYHINKRRTGEMSLPYTRKDEVTPSVHTHTHVHTACCVCSLWVCGQLVGNMLRDAVHVAWACTCCMYVLCVQQHPAVTSLRLQWVPTTDLPGRRHTIASITGIHSPKYASKQLFTHGQRTIFLSCMGREFKKILIGFLNLLYIFTFLTYMWKDHH